MSLKSLDKNIVKKRQVYKPILDNPFTNESHLWPHVEEQQFVWELLRTTVLCKVKNFADVPLDKWPWDILSSYNEIVTYLEDSKSDEDVILYVCNKDPGVSSVLLQQIPLLCYMSNCNVTLVQLPKGSLPIIQQSLDSSPLQCLDGLLLLRCNGKINSQFVTQVTSKVASLQFPWLQNVKYQPTNVKLVKTTVPISK